MADRAFGKKTPSVAFDAPETLPTRSRLAPWLMVVVVFVLCAAGLYTFYHFEMQRPENVAARRDREESLEYWQLDHYYVCNLLLRASSFDPKVPDRAKSRVEEAVRKYDTECESLNFEKAMWLRRLSIKVKYNFTSAPGRYWNNEVLLFPEGWRLGDEKSPARMQAILEQHRKR
jgi:hypothetical protein